MEYLRIETVHINRNSLVSSSIFKIGVQKVVKLLANEHNALAPSNRLGLSDEDSEGEGGKVSTLQAKHKQELEDHGIGPGHDGRALSIPWAYKGQAIMLQFGGGGGVG